MDAIALFCEIAAQRQKVAAYRYSRWNSYHHLIQSGLISEAGIVQSVPCDDCSQPHEAEIVFEGDRYGYYCPELGFVPVDRSALIAVRANIASFVSCIAQTLNCRRQKSTPVLGETWRIGAVETNGGELAMYFQATMANADDIGKFEAAIAKEMKSTFAVVFSTAGLLSFANFKTILIADVIDFDKGTASLTVQADLFQTVGIPVTRKGGRPNEFEARIQATLTERKRSGRALTGRNEEAEAVFAELKAATPFRSYPSLPTIKRYVSTERSRS